jgi:hypothetical protein
MAITFIDQIECSLCGEKLTNIDQIFGFSPFVQNIKDPFYQFNDASLHKKCLDNHPLGSKAIDFAAEFYLKTRPKNRICVAGGNLINNYVNYIFIDLLSSDEHEELSRFNFTTLDRNNLKAWNDRDLFLKIAMKFREDGKWEDLSSFKYLDNLIDTIM